MSISGIGAAPPTGPVSRPERSEGPGPDKVNDHDADDGASTQAASSDRLVDKLA